MAKSEKINWKDNPSLVYIADSRHLRSIFGLFAHFNDVKRQNSMRSGDIAVIEVSACKVPKRWQRQIVVARRMLTKRSLPWSEKVMRKRVFKINRKTSRYYQPWRRQKKKHRRFHVAKICYFVSRTGVATTSFEVPTVFRLPELSNEFATTKKDQRCSKGRTI